MTAAPTPGGGAVLPVVLVGLKAYLTHARTFAWFAGLRGLIQEGRADGLSLVVAPSATALAPLVVPAAEAGVLLAAQDCSPHPAGPWTGELPASLIAEIGARYVMVGHVERRRLGDTDEVITAKVRALVAAGLAPIVCVGELERTDASSAARESVAQLERSLDGVPADMPVMVAYEPVWAIGAREPAPSEHIVAVAERVRPWLQRFPAASLVYGGAAGPGTYREIAGAVDGLGLGRRVHEVAALAEVLDEMREAPARAERTT